MRDVSGRAVAVALAAVLHSSSMTVGEVRYTVPETTMTGRAKGEFDVKLTPQSQDQASGLGRMSIDKTYRGDLAGNSVGEMLSAMSKVEGSGVYVAVERVTGTLAGRQGSFALHHTGVMDRGKPSLTISVVPDSGTEGLSGMTGRMTIEIKDGKHLYELEYTLAENP